jgi:hypothetical protein
MENNELQTVERPVEKFLEDWDLYEQWFIFYVHRGYAPVVADELAYLKACNNEAIPTPLLA